MHFNSINNVNNLILHDTCSMINASIEQASITNVSAVNGSFNKLYVNELFVDPAWIDNCCFLSISVTQSASFVN